MILTPKGLAVKSLAFRISSRVHSTVRPPVAIIPAPPALETAAARFASEVYCLRSSYCQLSYQKTGFIK